MLHCSVGDLSVSSKAQLAEKVIGYDCCHCPNLSTLPCTQPRSPCSTSETLSCQQFGQATPRSEHQSIVSPCQQLSARHTVNSRFRLPIELDTFIQRSYAEPDAIPSVQFSDYQTQYTGLPGDIIVNGQSERSYNILINIPYLCRETLCGLKRSRFCVYFAA